MKKRCTMCMELKRDSVEKLNGFFFKLVFHLKSHMLTDLLTYIWWRGLIREFNIFLSYFKICWFMSLIIQSVMSVILFFINNRFDHSGIKKKLDWKFELITYNKRTLAKCPKYLNRCMMTFPHPHPSCSLLCLMYSIFILFFLVQIGNYPGEMNNMLKNK